MSSSIVIVRKLNLTRPNSLIDTIASNNSYRWNLPYANSLTHSHTPNLEMLSHQKQGYYEQLDSIYVEHISFHKVLFSQLIEKYTI